MGAWKLIAAALYGASAVRSRKAGSDVAPRTKFIGDVPILNYHLAYEGNTGVSLAEKESLTQDWIIVLKKGITDKAIAKLCTLSKCVRKGHPNKGGMPFFEIHACESELQALVKQAGSSVDYVEPDSRVYKIPELAAASNAASWSLDRIGAAKRSNLGDGVHVYVLDTGVRSSHDDFGGRATPALDMSSGWLVECDGSDSNCGRDRDGHGTHCAGSATGSSYGVAPNAEVHAGKVLGDDGSGSWSWTYDSLDWLATKGERPAVASMSLGGSGTQNAMRTAVTTAVDAGVVVVVAGGNENSNACKFSPAFVPAAITVGSTTSKDTRSYFSNYGSCTDIWAPGSDITSASHTSDSGSATMSGTSMACPHVSGASALVLEANPGMTAAEVIDKLVDTAVTGAITGLREGDVNKLLYVGTSMVGPAPAPQPLPGSPNCPSGPDGDGDCSCASGLVCFEGGKRGCTYSFTRKWSYDSLKYFSATCTTCECKASSLVQEEVVAKDSKGGKGKGGKKSKVGKKAGAQADC